MEKKHLLSFLVIAMLALFLTPSVADAQQRNMTIVTNHPDFSLKVKRCAASGNTVIIDMIIENLGANDVTIGFGSRFSGNTGRAWDDQGNEYDVFYKYANGNNFDWDTGGHTLISGVPTKLSVKIDKVPIDAESIAKLQLHTDCRDWGLDGKPAVIRNIPITRQ